MTSKLKKKEFLPFIILLIITLISLPIIILVAQKSTWNNYIILCRLGLIICIFATIFLVWQQKRVISVINILFASFVLFQFGLPIIYAFNSNYYSFYINLFDITIIVDAACYSIISILSFALFLSISLLYKRHKSNYWLYSFKALNNVKYVKNISFYIFLVSAAIVVPLYAKVMLITLTYGFSQSTRGILSSTSIYNLGRILFFSSAMLHICYAEKKSLTKRIVEIIFLFSMFLALIIGDRSESVVCMLVFVYNKYANEGKEINIKKTLIAFLGVIAIAVGAVYVANARIAASNTSILNVNILQDLMSEMGFNFTSICFVMQYVPEVTGYQYGLSYLNSLLTIIPKSIDPTGYVINIRDNLPVMWLFNLNHIRYSGALDWGVGFSFIGETYMNFSWLGFIFTSIFAFLIGRILNDCEHIKTSWCKYIQLILLKTLFMFPRQCFIEPIDSLKYSFLFVVVVLISIHQLFYRNKSNVIN